MINSFDSLAQACTEPEKWPLNLCYKQQITRVLQTRQKRLLEDQRRLFSDTQAAVEFWEAPIGRDSKFICPSTKPSVSSGIATIARLLTASYFSV